MVHLDALVEAGEEPVALGPVLGQVRLCSDLRRHRPTPPPPLHLLLLLFLTLPALSWTKHRRDHAVPKTKGLNQHLESRTPLKERGE